MLTILNIVFFVGVYGYVEQCNLGKFGVNCTKICPKGCAYLQNGTGYCDKYTGKCSQGCNSGWYGEYCHQSCSKNCVNNICNFINAECTLGCVDNYKGDFCEITTGFNCSECGENCSSNCNSHCDKLTGVCSAGCKPGWHGDFCNETCSGNCLNRLCEQKRGHCVLGCVGTHTGEFCEETQGTTKAVLISALLASIAAVIAIIAVIVAITICIRRKSQDAEEPAEEPSKETMSLIEHKKIVIDEKENINTILHEACKNEDMDQITNLLVEHDINSIDENNKTPIMVAALYGKSRVVELLLGKGANLSQEDKYGCNILHLACMNGHVKIAELVLRPDNVNGRGLDAVTPVMIAADHGYVNMVELLVREGADVSLEDAVGNNILHKASRRGHLETVKYILTKGMVSIDSRGQYQLTPVMMAAEHGHKAVVEFFVEREANLSLVDEFRNTILHRACRGGYLPTVEYVLSETKHYIFTRNGQERTPVLEAEYKGHATVVTFLKAEM